MYRGDFHRFVRSSKSAYRTRTRRAISVEMRRRVVLRNRRELKRHPRRSRALFAPYPYDAPADELRSAVAAAILDSENHRSASFVAFQVIIATNPFRPRKSLCRVQPWTERRRDGGMDRVRERFCRYLIHEGEGGKGRVWRG